MPPKTKSIEETYQKKTQHEHILDLPDSYIGGVEPKTEELEILVTDDNGINKITKKEITWIPGLYKIFDEILVNAIDHSIRDNNLKNIKVTMDNQTISVWNDGDGIDVEMHKEHNVYVPELIFGHLLTSTNYDKSEEKIIGGKNGFGAKLTNIFSKEFVIETIDSERNKKFKQTYRNNMNEKDKAVVKPSNKKSYTMVTFTPDYERFGITELSDDMISLFEKRVYDVCALTYSDVSVYLNSTKIKVKQFEDYVNLYIGNKKEASRIHERIHERWEYVVAYNPEGTFEQISFVNGIWTMLGGTHVQYIVNQIVKKLDTHIKKGKNKDVTIKPQYIRDHIKIFLKSTIVNPSFSSQTKDSLTSKIASFGSKCEVSNDFIKKLAATDIIKDVLSFAQFKEEKELKKTDGKKKIRLVNIPKLDDANFAGTVKSKDCTLIIVEGDSARTFANSGLSIVGHDYYGVFPLKGKPLNVREATATQQVQNAEISNIKQILGLQMNKKYTTLDSLRYGKLMVLTDADDDGTHIKGLIINMIHYWWPELLQIPGFLKSMVTPVVKITKGKQSIDFKNIIEYNKWKNKNDSKGWTVKYYKGLGTSTSNEAKQYFKEIDNNQLFYEWDNKSTEVIQLAFQKDLADKRKEWIQKYNSDEQEDKTVNNTITYDDFINSELINYSYASNIRTIPSIHDGLKPSQRKVLYCTFLRNLISEIKVAQLAGYVSEKSSYHHGEMSLQSCIINMAQTHIGTNNINTLVPSGQFGTRLMGGKDAASPRYIFTYLELITKCIFNSKDFALLNQLNDDGFLIEPEWYLPILPMVLVNGADGIGTGFSTKIPQYNPLDIVRNIELLLDDKEQIELIPYYRGFTGDIEKDTDNSYFVYGKYKRTGDKTVQITELPLNTWTYNYQEFLETMIEDPKNKKKQYLSSFTNNNTDTSVNMELIFKNKTDLDKLIENPTLFDKTFKLVSKLNISNMYLFNSSNTIQKYNTPEEILQEYFVVRLEFYEKRKEFLLNILQKELDILKYKVKFIESIINEEIVIFNKKKDVVINILEDEEYPRFSLNKDVASYNYLLDMKIWTFTEEKINQLKDIRDNKLGELTELLAKDKFELWRDDIELFKTEYETHLLYYERMKYCDLKSTNGKKSKVIVKTPKKAKKVDNKCIK
jgi:DNA topoisomerase-2